MNDTPRTDAAYTQRPNEGAWDFKVRQEKTMESLERELTAAQEEIENLKFICKCENESSIEAHDILKAVTIERDEFHVKIEELAIKLETVTEQRDEARKLAERYRNLSCDSQEEADETLLPWENNQTNEL